MMLSTDKRISGGDLMPCGCGAEFADIYEGKTALMFVVAVHTKPGIIWQVRPTDEAPPPPAAPDQAYPIINGHLVGDESGEPVLFPRLGAFEVRCTTHGPCEPNKPPASVVKER